MQDLNGPKPARGAPLMTLDPEDGSPGKARLPGWRPEADAMQISSHFRSPEQGGTLHLCHSYSGTSSHESR
jgi:hypothetical protein